MESQDFWVEPDVRGRWKRLIELLAPRPGERILDIIGFGPGIATRYVAAQVGPGGLVSAIDTSPRALERFRAAVAAEGIDNIRICEAGVESLPFPDDSFDAVMCVNVLEAVPDKARALRAMHRVISSDGRVLIAHDDYESQVNTTTDRALGRRVTLAYARATFETDPTRDGQMGRHLWGLLLKSPFTRPRLHILPLVNTEYRQSLLGWVHAQFTVDFVSRVRDLTQAELDQWRADLEARSTRGEYLYCLNLYTCLGSKRPASGCSGGPATARRARRRGRARPAAP